MPFSTFRMTSQVNVLMDAPTVRTRLLSPPPSQHNDYFFIYVSTIVTVTVLLSSAFLVWRWGLQGFGTHLSVALAIALLIFNAYLGARAWADLHQQYKVFLKYQIYIKGVNSLHPSETYRTFSPPRNSAEVRLVPSGLNGTHTMRRGDLTVSQHDILPNVLYFLLSSPSPELFSFYYNTGHNNNLRPDRCVSVVDHANYFYMHSNGKS